MNLKTYVQPFCCDAWAFGLIIKLLDSAMDNEESVVGVGVVAGSLAIIEYRLSRLEGKNDEDAAEQAVLVAISHEEMDMQRELTDKEQNTISVVVFELLEAYE